MLLPAVQLPDLAEQIKVVDLSWINSLHRFVVHLKVPKKKPHQFPDEAS